MQIVDGGVLSEISSVRHAEECKQLVREREMHVDCLILSTIILLCSVCSSLCQLLQAFNENTLQRQHAESAGLGDEST